MANYSSSSSHSVFSLAGATTHASVVVVFFHFVIGCFYVVFLGNHLVKRAPDVMVFLFPNHVIGRFTVGCSHEPQS